MMLMKGVIFLAEPMEGPRCLIFLRRRKEIMPKKNEKITKYVIKIGIYNTTIFVPNSHFFRKNLFFSKFLCIFASVRG